MEAPASGGSVAGAPPLSLDRVWVILAVGLPVVGVLFGVMATVDLAYHVRAGQMMLDGHHLLRTDTWTFTVAGTSWLDQQWLAQLAFALVYRFDGWPALAALRAVLVGVTYGAVLVACRYAGAGIRQAAALTLLAFALSLENLPMRPQLFAFALFGLSLWLVERRRRSPRSVWVVPALMVPWVSLHGSFPLGIALLGFAALEDAIAHEPRVRTTLWALAAAIGATLINPFGWRVWQYAISIGTNPSIRNLISEWQPPTYHSYTGVAFFASVAAIALFFARRREPVPWLTMLRLGVFFALSLLASRNIAWWGLAMPVALAGTLPAPRARAARTGSPVLNLGVVLVLVAAGVIALPWFRSTPLPDGSSRLLSYDPEGLVRATAAHVPPGSNVFVTQAWGPWFEFALPQDRVYVDARIELFSAAIWNEWSDLAQGREGWQGILDRYGVDAAVLDDSQTGFLLSRMRTDPGWKLVYHDEEGYVFVRSTG